MDLSNSPAAHTVTAFLLVFAGIVMALQDVAGQVFVFVCAVLVVAAVLQWTRRIRYVGFADRFRPIPAGLAVCLLALVGGMARGASAESPSDVLAAFSGYRVGTVVEIGRVIRRDAAQVMATGRLISLQGPGGIDVAVPRDSPITIRCMPGKRRISQGGCARIVRGGSLAISGKAGWSPRHGSSITIIGTSAVLPVVFPGERPTASGSWGDPVDKARARLTFLCIDRLRGAAAWLVPALVLGEGAGVPPTSRNILSVLGTAHVLSVSGLHVVAVSAAFGVFVFLLLGLPAAFLFPRLNVAAIAAASTVISAWLVGAVAGFPPPAIRAAGMATVFVVSRFMSRTVPGEGIVAAVGVVEILIHPADALSISFQLSYAAVFGILVVGRAINGLSIPPVPGLAAKAVKALRSSLAVSVGASLATLPPGLIYFGSAPLIGPVANLAVIPMFTFVGLPGSFLMLAILAINPNVEAGVGLSGLAVDLFCRSVDLIMAFQVWIARLVPAVLSFPPHPAGMAMAAVSGAFVVWMSLGRGWHARVAAVVTAACIVVIPNWNPPPDGQVVFLNVAKGDATLIRCPSGDEWLVDAGPPGSGGSPLLAALSRAGARRIAGVVLTHAHDDHYGGIPELVEWFGPIELAASPSALRELDWLADLVVAAGGRTRGLNPGDQALPGCGVDSRVLASDLVETVSQHENEKYAKNLNDNSVVFRFGNRETGVLFVGDLEMKGEEILMAGGPDLQAGVLKVGHHGSLGATGEKFLRSVAPNTAIVQGWPSGPRSGPADAVLARFIQQKCRVMATTLWGDITLDTRASGSTKSALSPVFKPQNAFPDGFGGRDRPAGLMTRPVKTSLRP